MTNLDDLQKKLGVKFRNQELLIQSLTHRSSLNEGLNTSSSNERLEFLGDTILSFIVSHWLYQRLPEQPEGRLTNIRSYLVKSDTLAQISQQLGVGEHLVLGKGEKESGGQKNPSLLGNTLEAIIGAVFLDQGMETTKKFILKVFSPFLQKISKGKEFKDFKSVFQEKLQAQTKYSPVYKTISQSGPDHAKVFTVGVYYADKLISTGKGKSKQEAEEEAARLAIKNLH